MQPVETAFGEMTGEAMLISATRATTLKLANQREAAAPRQPVLMRGAQAFDLPAALAVADPALDMQNPLKGPFKALPLGWETQARAALELARMAGVLPAFLVDPQGAGEAVSLSAGDVAAFADASRLQIATRARLPVAAAEDARIVATRAADERDDSYQLGRPADAICVSDVLRAVRGQAPAESDGGPAAEVVTALLHELDDAVGRVTEKQTLADLVAGLREA